MPFCAGCGRQLAGGVFCPYCGRPQEQPVRPPGRARAPGVAPGAALPHRALLTCSIAGALALGAAAAGAFLPWLGRSGPALSGTDRDGWLTFALALAGAAACLLSAILKSRWPFLPALLFATSLLAVGVFDVFDIMRTPGLSAANVGAGLWVTVGAGLFAVVACAAGLALAPESAQEYPGSARAQDSSSFSE